MKNIATLFTLALMLLTAPLFAQNNAFKFEDFEVTYGKVGIVTSGMSIADLFILLPRNQVKKATYYDAIEGYALDKYNLYDADGTLMLTVYPEHLGDGSLQAKIGSVDILSSKFDNMGIYLGSSFCDVLFNHLEKINFSISEYATTTIQANDGPFYYTLDVFNRGIQFYEDLCCFEDIPITRVGKDLKVVEMTVNF